MAESRESRKSEIVGLYNRVAATYGRVGPDTFSYVGRRLVELISFPTNARVLDVASGRGANLFAVAEKLHSHGMVVGIDLAEKMVQETSREIHYRGLRNATMQQMDAEHLSFLDAYFDDVLCGFAIFFFPHVEQALSEFTRVLRPGGTLGITTARNPDQLSCWYGQRITEYHDIYHFPLNAGTNAIDVSNLPATLLHKGFSDVQIIQEEIEFIYIDEQEWWSARWTHGPRYSLERMPPEALHQFQNEVFRKLQDVKRPDGIHESWQIQYMIATKRKENYK
jgi:O-methyltransferase/aklanonic acid methyltransferase